MKIFQLFFVVIFINVIAVFGYEQSDANFKPTQKDQGQRTRASGTRGCPSPIGDLFIVGVKFENNFIMQQTGLDTPSLLYEIKTEQEETFLITITDSNNNLIYEKSVIINPNQREILITLERPIQEGIKYQVVAGLLCEGEPEGAKIINSLLLKVNSLTVLDQMTRKSQSKENYSD